MRVAIGEWNEAWGPEPRPVRPRPSWSARNAWHRVWCPRTECLNAVGYAVYAPLARGGRETPERYCCAVCGEEMRRERVPGRARRP